MMEIFSTPNVAFLLMALGLYGLIYEFVTPGIFLPGITGAICVLLASFGIDHLPVNYFGLLLMIVGIGCMTAEAFVRFIGVLGVIGAISFAYGGTIFITATPPGPVSPWLIGSLTLVSLGILSVGLKLILRTRTRAVATGTEALRNATGEIVTWSQTTGEVRAAGSIWKARSTESYILKKGDKVKVSEIDGLCLIIQPLH